VGNVTVEISQTTNGKAVASGGTTDSRAVGASQVTKGTFKKAPGTLIVDAEGFVKFVPDVAGDLTAVRAVA
jgi:hypothetical protein